MLAEAKSSKKSPSSSGKIWSAFIFVVMVGSALIYVALSPRPEQFVIPHIKSAPYVWPKGCENKIYNDGDRIPSACADNAYMFKDAEKYGFNSSRGVHAYYRVNNDAIAIACGFYSSCYVDRIIKDVFY